MTLDPAEQSASGSEQVTDLGALVVRPAHVFSIPAAQRYYWTEGWQAGERETLHALRDACGIRFPSGKAFVEWLVRDADDIEPNGD